MWSRNKANLYIRDALNDFHYDPKATPSPIAQRKIYRNKLMLTHLIGFGSGISSGAAPDDVTSYLFDGVDDFLSVDDHADWVFGSGNFTIDFWVRFTTTDVDEPLLITQKINNSNNWKIRRTDKPGIDFGQYEGGVHTIGSGSKSWDPSDDTWYHVALIRGWSGNANDYAITIDGTLQGTSFTDDTDVADFAVPLTIGGFSGAAERNILDGNMDEIRVSKGIARWTTDFTPETSQYVSDANTVLLIHCGETIVSGTTGSGATFVDSGNTGHTVTENADAIRDVSVYKF